MLMKIAKPFEEGLRQRELLLPWCKGCRKPHFYPRSACPYCWGEEYEWRRAEGRGRIHTFATVRANPPSAFASAVPYVVAIIDLAEGVRMLSNVAGDPKALAVGAPVRVEFIERDGQTLPVFRCA
jgi:uncharacterized OB-fold protein